jgi:hypothetical protein
MTATPSTGSRTDKNGITWETINTPTFEFRMAYRKIELPTVQDQGPTVEVYGRDGDELQEVLKFDCFEVGPHWHRCRTGEKDEISPITGGSMDAGLDFAVTVMRDRFEDLVSDQGFSKFTTADRSAELHAALPGVEQRMREMIRERGPAQILKPAMM